MVGEPAIQDAKCLRFYTFTTAAMESGIGDSDNAEQCPILDIVRAFDSALFAAMRATSMCLCVLLRLLLHDMLLQFLQ